MGAQIAAHLANAGLPVLLFDVTLEAARAGLKRLGEIEPNPLFEPAGARLIQPASLDDLDRAADADWMIEAVVEDLQVKRTLAERLERVAHPDTVISSNTSGIPLRLIAEGRSLAWRRRWLGTHFFNPPRYLPLVEVVPTEDTSPDVTARVGEFLDRRLGKGVVLARDTPGFIANRIGAFGAVRTIEALADGYRIEEIDAVTGTPLGRPKTATFRTLDLTGLDLFVRVVRDLAGRLPDEAASFQLPPFVDALVQGGGLGAKSGRGFYQRRKEDGETRILVLDPASLEYQPASAVHLPSIDAVGAMTDPAARIRQLFLSHDRVGELVRRTLGATLLYAARVAPAIASSLDDVDRAMRWGFGWDLGPFEIWDAIGIDHVLTACQVADPPPLVREALAAKRQTLRPGTLAPAHPDLLLLRTSRAARGVVKSNAGASLVDLGDDVLALELHSKLNTIGEDTLRMLEAGVRMAAERWRGLVLGTTAETFSAGANLMLLLLEAQEGNWDEVDRMVRAFQHATAAVKFSPVPVVAAPSGLCLGGGCEICLHADRIESGAELYMGLVETGVGLIPAGGGTKEMLLRALDRAAGDDPSHAVQGAFETMALARLSTSAPHARRLGYLRAADGFTMHRERVIADAKAVALARSETGYRPPVEQLDIPVGGADLFARLSLGVHLAWRAGRASDHDALVGRKLAWIITGGDLPHASVVSERYLLDLEREAFLSLCGEPKTLERIAHTLKTGKMLRN
jgi:3-hydroxyacyl-CoA dehydrogenase